MESSFQPPAGKCLTAVSGLCAVYMFVFLLFSTDLQNPAAVWFGKFNPWYVENKTIRIMITIVSYYSTAFNCFTHTNTWNKDIWAQCYSNISH